MTRLQTWRVEWFIARIRPEINCTLFLLGFYLGVSLLLTHLSWYGIPPAPPGWIAESHRMLMKMCIFLILVAAIALVAPGSAHRRLFAACAFPLLALLAMVVHDVSLPLVNSAAVFTHFPLAALLQAIALGSVVALVVSLPVAVLFRGSCSPVVLLVILPALAKEQSVVLRGAPPNATMWPLAILLCEATIVVVSTYGCHRCLLSFSDGGVPSVGAEP
jgi:hypothetical protein